MTTAAPTAASISAAGTATTTDTSAASFDALSLRQRDTKQQQLLDLVVGAQRNGRADMSGRELQADYERVHGQRIESASVASCLNGLVAAGRLQRATVMRACSVTGRDILPVFVPVTQARLLA